MSRKDSIKDRQEKVKDAFLDQLKRTPTIETACQKVNTARSTVYRWIKSNKKFEAKVDDALNEGRMFMSDVAESQRPQRGTSRRAVQHAVQVSHCCFRLQSQLTSMPQPRRWKRIRPSAGEFDRTSTTTLIACSSISSVRYRRLSDRQLPP